MKSQKRNSAPTFHQLHSVTWKNKIILLYNIPVLYMFERLRYECALKKCTCRMLPFCIVFTLCDSTVLKWTAKSTIVGYPPPVYVYIHTYAYMHTACLYIWDFHVLCWVIVLDWTVKYCVWGWVVIFITVSVFHCHYLLLLIYRMRCMHL